MSDLTVLVADKDTRFALKGLLSRPGDLGIRPLTTEIHAHPRHDPGVRTDCHSFLRSFLRRTRYALVVLDLEGSGHHGTRDQLEADLESRLSQNGWEGRCAVVVIEPELENWVWTNSRLVDESLGWPCGGLDLRAWLSEQGHLSPGQQKPLHPKEAVLAALRYARKGRSSGFYGELATGVDFRGCMDQAFQKLVSRLQLWFPEIPSTS